MLDLIPTSPSTILLSVGFFALSFFLYRRALPQVIPGIPHNKDAAKSILGDVPEFLKYVKDNQGEAVAWWHEQLVKHNSPIVQLFIRPFSKPFVIVADFREQQDVLLRRTKEFDRSKFFGDLFEGTLPHHHIMMPTNDKLRAQKRLLADTMMPSFLNEVSWAEGTVSQLWSNMVSFTGCRSKDL